LKILFDTNVILDVLLDREPSSSIAAKLFSIVETGEITGYVCATTITTLHYLTRKVVGDELALKEINKLMLLFEIAPVNRAVLDGALKSGYKDFEDAVVHESGVYKEVQAMVTRDAAGFKKSKVNIHAPEELLLMLKSKKEAKAFFR
jgi:predicted nucleic acid-binding protein